MRHFAILPVVGAVLTLSACSSGAHNPVSTIPSVDQRRPPERRAASVAYAVIHSFGGPGDGATPHASLLNVNGTLYGTTVDGGAHGKGTVFSIAPSGTESVLHSFNGSDGAYPYVELTDVNGTLYGTTGFGGTHNKGTVFSITPSGTETVVHSFRGGADDGENPEGSLVNVDGTLYGTTSRGGQAVILGYGVVFSVTPSGTETVVHTFRNGSEDGASPYGSLIVTRSPLGPELHGTTYHGGEYADGTIFDVAPSGDFFLTHSFDWADGAYPHAGLVNVGGTLYGTTTRGGPIDDRGTVFAQRAGFRRVKVLHDFTGPGDGADPHASLHSVEGTLYGTTKDGGANVSGTVFSIAPDGTGFTQLHSFGGSGDGAIPYAGLANVGGTLYGTTTRGGAHDKGIVYSITP